MRLKISGKSAVKSKNELVMSFIYRESFTDFDKGRELFEILMHSDFLPNKYSIWPTNKKEEFSYEKINVFLNEKWMPFNKYDPNKKCNAATIEWLYIYKTAGVKYWGDIMRNGGEDAKFQSQISFYIDAISLKEASKVKELVFNLLSYAKVDFARLQFYSGEEVFAGRRGEEPNSTLVARQLSEQCLPDLYNISIWGKPYIEFFGREKLMSAPCYKVEDLPSGDIWMQLAPHVYDEKGSWSAIKDVRAKVKAHLDNNAFYDPSLYKRQITIHDLEKDPILHEEFLSGELMKERYKVYNVPKFDLSDIRKPLMVQKRTDSERS